tara:strand:+ start:600 stop:1130 length:531 start_codon:yes stop_codon:yes gene_type:complete
MKMDMLLKPTVRKSYEKNLKATSDTHFKYILTYLLEQQPGRVARFHVSGDFFSQRYINSVFYACRQNPGKVFFAFSKSLHLKQFNFKHKPQNLRLISSHNKGKHRAIVVKRPADTPEGYKLCEGHCGEHPEPGENLKLCSYCWTAETVRVAFWSAKHKSAAKAWQTKRERKSNNGR